MKKIGFTITTAEGHFLSRYAINKASEGHEVDAGFDKDIFKSLSSKNINDANETKKILNTYHPDMRLWVIQVFKNKGKAFFKSTSAENPPWFKQSDRFSGFYSA